MKVPTLTPPVQATHAIDTRPISADPAGTLALQSRDAAGRTFVSAASGIAAVGGKAWVVSDEYGELAHFEQVNRPGVLLPGLAPAGGGKPDLEAILRIPHGDGQALLALGSGSKANRNRAVLQPVDRTGVASERPREVDLSPLYAELGRRLKGQPNVEGAVWRGTPGARGAELLLFHRGQSRGETNTIFRLDGAAVLDALRGGRAIPASTVLDAQAMDLGRLNGEQLGFADARALPDGRIAFAASAEGSGAGSDGDIMGSVVGLLDARLQVTALRPLTGNLRKVEGIELASELDPSAPADRVVLVTDPDNPRLQTEVLTAKIGAA